MKIVCYHPSDDASYWYRCKFPLQTLAEHGLAEFRSYTSPTLDSNFKPDIVIFQRLVDPRYLELAKDFRSQGVKIVYELDDDYEHLPKKNMAHLVCSNRRDVVLTHFRAYRDTPGMRDVAPQYKYLLEHDEKWVADTAIENFSRMVRFIRMADLVQVSTEQLRKTYSGFGAKNIVVLPNLEKESEWNVVKAPLLGRIVVGWAGSFSHFFSDIKPIVNAVTDVMDRNPSVHLHLIGGKEFGSLFPRAPKDRIFSEDWSGWEKYKEHISEFDICLAPSFDEPKFSRGKSTIRVQQTWMKGIPCIGSEQLYGKIIKESGGGLVARSPREWNEKLNALCDNNLRRELGQYGLSYMKENTFENRISEWNDVYTKLVEAK